MKSGRNIVTGGTYYILINAGMALLYGFLLGLPLKEVLILTGIISFFFKCHCGKGTCGP
ncbi:hypothetical protein RCO48_03710 [Peribacillus frigoritolerans]|nr:hypothetical protein [Peribacillus frigoritolerans]